MKRITSVGSVLIALTAAGCSPARDQGTRGKESLGSGQLAIIDGYVDDADKAAVGLAINIFNAYFMGHCSGTLIAPNLVLTARHCVALTSGGGPQGSVVCGQTNFTNTGGGAMFRVTTETVRPNADGPEFYKGTGNVIVPPESADICGNDIAMILLEGAGIPESVTKPIVPRIDSRPEQLEEYAAIGYGLTDPNNQNSSGTRMRRDGNLVSCLGGLCSGFVGEQVKETEWLGGEGTCPGDSGGPAIDSLGRVMGVLSRGPQPCLASTYGDVSKWKDLIIATALDAAEQGGYPPPFWATTGSSIPPEPDAGAGGGGGSGGGAGGSGSTGTLGEACSPTDPCSGGYLCLSDDGTTGSCVPPCSASSTACPADHTCDTGMGACVPAADPKTNASGDDGGGCSLSGPAKPVPWVVGLAAAGLLLRLRRRRYG